MLSGNLRSYLDFEKPVAELEAKVEELRAMGEANSAVAIDDEVMRLEAKAGAARPAHARGSGQGRQGAAGAA